MGIVAATTQPQISIVARTNRITSTDVERGLALCSNCDRRDLCFPCGIGRHDASRVDALVFTRRRLKRGEDLYRVGAPFRSLYAVSSGFFKSYLLAEDGREQITGFQMSGEVVGLDGIETDVHSLGVKALEDATVCVIPFAQLEEMAGRIPKLQRQFHRMMSREIVRDQGVMMLLGSMHAEERLAVFLLNLSQRFAARGYSAAQFNLRMTREEIGSYLGLKLETVSRIFSKFQQLGLIGIDKKSVRLLNMVALKAVFDRAA